VASDITMDNLDERIRKLSPEKRALFEQRLIKVGLKKPVTSTDSSEFADDSASSTEAIAIIGMACRFPKANDPSEFWELLRQGIDAISEIPGDRWDIDAYYDKNPSTPGKMYSRWGGFIDHVDQFSPGFFHITPGEAERMDPQHRLLLEISWEALETAGYASESVAGSDTGVFIGMSSNDYLGMQFDLPTTISAYSGTGNARCLAANRISYQYDFRGPSFVVDTACSSSLYAIHLACQSLRTYETTMCLAGATNLILTPQTSITFSQARMLAPDGRCKTFDASADGYVRGEGAGIIMLKRLRDALKDNDQVLAVIRGSATSQDGLSNGITAPNGPAQQSVIRSALHNANVTAADVGYIEAHGTGTGLGDPIEMGALAEVLGEGRSREQPCLVGSVKTNIGHLEAAAGIAGLIKIVLSLQNEEIPPHLHVKQVNPHIPIKKMPLEIPLKRTSWKRSNRHRYAGLSAFGFGGANAHIVLEEAPERMEKISEHERPIQLLTLCAQTETALLTLAERFADYLELHPELPLAQVCYSANTGRRIFPHRLAVLSLTLQELITQLRNVTSGEPSRIAWKCNIESAERQKVAFLFSGQISLCKEGVRELYESQAEFRRTLVRCSKILNPRLGGQLLLDILSPGGTEKLSPDEKWLEQMAIFSVQYALAKLWISWGVKPDALLGADVGEYVVACLAGVFSLEEGLILVTERARMMDALSSAGNVESILASYRERLEEIEFKPAQIAVVGARRGDWWTKQDGKVDYWLDQLRSPAQFENGVQHLSTEGYALCVSIETDASWKPVLTTLGRLYVKGMSVNWQGFEQDYVEEGSRYRVPLPTYPFERQRYWFESKKSVIKQHAANKVNDSQDKNLLYQYSWVQQSLFHGEEQIAEPGIWLLFDAGDPVQTDLIPCLQQKGETCIRITPASSFRKRGEGWYELNPALRTDFEKLMEVVFQNCLPLRGVVHQWSLLSDTKVINSADEFLDQQQYGLASAINLLQTLKRKCLHAAFRIWIVTRSAQAVKDDVEETQISSAGIWGLGRVLAREYPAWWGGLIDLGRVPGAKEAIFLADEIFASDITGDEIAYRDGIRYVARLSKFSGIVESNASLSGDSTYLLVGGMGGIGGILCKWLFEHGARYLVVTGRSELSAEKNKLLEELVESGCRIHYFRVDATDYSGMSSIFAWIEQEMPRLKGVFHVAGVLDDAAIGQLDWPRIRKVLIPKIGGAWVLNRLTAQLTLDFFVLFSSAGALLGSPGQAAYSAANASMDGMAMWRRSHGLPALSVNWGPWSDAGMASRLTDSEQARLTAHGITALSSHQSLSILSKLLFASVYNVAVLDMDWQRYSSHIGFDKLQPLFAGLIENDEVVRQFSDDGPGNIPLDEYKKIPEMQQRAWLVNYLREQVSYVLGRDKEQTQGHQNLVEIGMDSIRFIEVINKINDDLGVALYPTEFQEYPAIDDMAIYLAGLLNEDYEVKKRVIKENNGGVQTNNMTESMGQNIDRWSTLVNGEPRVNLSSKPCSEASPCFLLSSPRAGSTLLRVMLSSHSDLFCPPELHLLPFSNMQERSEALHGTYLGEGLERAFMELLNLPANMASRYVKSLSERNVEISEVYDLLQSQAGRRQIIDKSPSYAVDPAVLARAEVMFKHAKYIHLIRHPYSVIDSFVKNRIDKVVGIECADPYILAEEVWTKCNRNICNLLSTINPDRCITVLYEDLVRDPEKILRKLSSFLELPFSPDMLHPYESGNMTDGLHRASLPIGDPNFMQHSKIDMKLADKWKTIKLPTPLGYAARKISERFGYSAAEAPMQSFDLPMVENHQLVAIQPEGSRPPLFCIHPSGGQVYAYHGLLSTLGRDQPLFGIQSRALGDICLEHLSVDSMACEYTKIIRQSQPQGPYHLLGWSMGGRLVLAITAELEKQGEQVNFAGLWDCRYPPIDASVLVDGDLPDISMAFGGSLIKMVSGLKPDRKEQLIKGLKEQAEGNRLRYLIEWGQKENALPANVPPEMLHDQAALVDYHIRLLKQHNPGKINAPLHVWWARDGLAKREATDWAEYTSGEVINHVVDGNHFSMVRAPGIHELAAQLKQCLDECLAENMPPTGPGRIDDSWSSTEQQ